MKVTVADFDAEKTVSDEFRNIFDKHCEVFFTARIFVDGHFPEKRLLLLWSPWSSMNRMTCSIRRTVSILKKSVLGVGQFTLLFAFLTESPIKNGRKEIFHLKKNIKSQRSAALLFSKRTEIDNKLIRN